MTDEKSKFTELQRNVPDMSLDKMDAVQRAMNHADALQRAAASMPVDKMDSVRRATNHADVLQRAASALPVNALDEATRRALEYSSALQRTSALPVSAFEEAARRATEYSSALQRTSALPVSPLEEAARRATGYSSALQRTSALPVNSAAASLPIAKASETKRALKLIESPNDIGRIVRISREIMGLTQQKFADLAGVGRRFVSELENGKNTLELGKVLKVCKAAGIDLSATHR